MSSLFLKDQYTPHFKALDQDEQMDLKNFSKKLNIQRDLLTQALLSKLKKMDTDVEELKRAISLDLKNVGLHYFKDAMKAITDGLDKNDNGLILKHKELLDRGKILSHEVKQIEQTVIDVSIGKPYTRTTLHYKPLETYHVNLPESIGMFDHFLCQSGGHCGRWRPEDHQLFLQLKSKHPPDQVAVMIHHRLPDISIDQVLEHNTWHDKYINLLQGKRETVEKWKSAKKSSQSQSLGNIPEAGAKAEISGSNPSTGRKSVQKSAEETKKLIAEWKLAKSERLKQEDELRRCMENEKLALENERNANRVIEKQRVAEYVHLKMETQIQQRKETAVKSERERRNAARKANIMIHMFRKQDQRRLEEKQERQQRVALACLESEQRLMRLRSKVNTRRDPSRLVKPTAVWKHRVEVKSESPCDANVPYIVHVSHLKVPDWRQDVKFRDQIIL